MIETVDNAMQAMQAAMLARGLYFENHPAVVEQERRAVELLTGLLKEQDTLTVLAFDDRVVFDNRPLPSSGSLCEGLFGRLRGRGAECLVIDRGVTAGEVTRLLAGLHEKAQPGDTVQASEHIRFGHIQGTADAGAGPSAAERAALGLPPRMQAAELQGVWRGLLDTGQCDGDALGGVVAEISAAVAMTGGAVLPLAGLKKHDEYTFVHTINVAILSTALAEAAGLKSQTVHDLTVAALMHDVGKRAIPKTLLNKNGPLTDAELAVMRRHPLEGARLLFGAKDIPEMAPIVAYEHHIHMNGKGYPHVTPGWRVSLASQIVQVADVFDALRTIRPYRAALSLDESAEIMRKGSGKQFDPTLLELFFERVACQTDREAEVPQPVGDNVVPPHAA